MQFKTSFAALLAGVLVALSAQDAEATPIARRNTGIVSLPLKRVEARSADVHPLIYLQQHVNRSLRRLARMSGAEVPSDLQLRSNLEKRMLSLSEGDLVIKRFNRPSYAKSGRSEDALSARFNRVHIKGKRADDFHKGDPFDSIAAALSGNDPVSAASGRRKKHGHGNGNGNGNGNANAGNATATVGATDVAGATATAGSSVASGSSLPIPADVTVSSPPNADNSLALDIEGNDVGYLATVQIGTPPRDFLILMDSGSADFWVGSEQCQTIVTQSGGQAGQDCGNHNFLGTKSSSSFQDSNTQFEVTYGTGQVSGNIIQDDIVLAGLKLQAHTFGVATGESVEFSSSDTSFDGLMGLAQSTLSNQKTLTPVEALAKQGLIAEAITSYKIPRLADNKADGVITFGGVDQSKFDAATLVTLDNVNTQGFWEANMDGVTVGGQDVGLKGRTAILDTGTTLIVAPANDAAAIMQQINGSGQLQDGSFTIPCQTTQQVALSFGGTEFAIDARDLAFSPLNNANGDCLAGIQAGNIGGNTEWLVGDVFLKNAYFSHDVNKNTVSLAKLV